MKDQVASAAKNDREKATEVAKNTCDTWAVNSVLPRSKTPTNIWTWIGMAIVALVCVVGSVFSGGTPLIALSAALPHVAKTTIMAIAITVAVVAGAGTGALTAVGAVDEVNKDKVDTMAKPAYAQLDQWNYKAKIKTIFNPNTGECTKETIYQNCTKESWSTGKCKVWGPEKTETQTIKLI